MHLAFIMDGNRRWAKVRGLDVSKGHEAGAKDLLEVAKWARKRGVKTGSVYALSTENYKMRDEKEISFLMKLGKVFFQRYLNKIAENGIRIKVLGRVDELPESIQKIIHKTEERTKDNKDFLLQVCFNYGGRDEIVRSVKKVIKNGGEVSEESISDNLDSHLQPDLIIRTVGRVRLSNFLLWQSAYSEIYVTDKYWPDFDDVELDKAIAFLNGEVRNFGS